MERPELNSSKIKNDKTPGERFLRWSPEYPKYRDALIAAFVIIILIVFMGGGYLLTRHTGSSLKKFINMYYWRGRAWHMIGDYERAIADYNKGLEINPQKADVYYSRLAEAHTFRGSARYMKGDYDRAIADFTKALEINPRNAGANNSKAWLLATCPDARYRNGAKAVELAQKALELDRSACCLDTLAAAYAEAGKFEDAITTQEKSIALHEKEGFTKNHIDKVIERLNYYKAHKPWREK